MMSDRDVSLPRSVCFQLAITPVLVQTCIPFYKQPLIANDLFWIGATKVEALFGLGRRDEAESLKTEIVEKERQRLTKAGRDGNAVNWMGSSLNDQLKKLGELLPP
jgi:hypothetical protein